MAYSRCVIICYCIVAVFANENGDPHACSPDSPGENALNGYEFLKKRQMLQLVMTSMESVYAHPGGYNVTCISAITTDVNEAAYEVTQTVYYKDLSEKWKRFSQMFQFSDTNGKLNKMENMETTGAPSGTYNFAYTTLGCTVITIEKFGERMSGDTSPDVDSDSSSEQIEDLAVPDNVDGAPDSVTEGNAGKIEDSKRLNCMVWANPRHEYIRGLQRCCEAHFTKYCKKNADHQHTPKRCPVPAVEGKSEL